MEKLVDLSADCSDVLVAIQEMIPFEKLRATLKHFTSTIRLVGFQTIQPIVTAYSTDEAEESSRSLATVAKEAELWKECFPYAIKTDGKEYTSSLLQSLTLFMDRLSNVESASLAAKRVETGSSSVKAGAPLPLLHSFVVDFLIFDVAVRQTAYPASVKEKESFASELLDCLLAFASRDPRLISKNVAVYERNRRPSESETAKKMLEALLSKEGLASPFALLHSVWDGSRSSSFRFLSRLVVVAQANELDIAPEYSSASVRNSMMARAVYLASSPRQRESDTGARVLAFLNLSLVNDDERWAHLGSLIDILDSRLTSMKDLLSSLLTGQIDASDGGSRLPLAHGLIQSLQLVLEHMERFSQKAEDDDARWKLELFQRMGQIFCRAIQVSLAVVADIKEGSMIEGMDEDMIAATGGESEKEGTPLNVNTGAIGANGTFSTINPTKEDEHRRRIATQRIVVSRKSRSSILPTFCKCAY